MAFTLFSWVASPVVPALKAHISFELMLLATRTLRWWAMVWTSLGL